MVINNSSHHVAELLRDFGPQPKFGSDGFGTMVTDQHPKPLLPCLRDGIRPLQLPAELAMAELSVIGHNPAASGCARRVLREAGHQTHKLLHKQIIRGSCKFMNARLITVMTLAGVVTNTLYWRLNIVHKTRK